MNKTLYIVITPFFPTSVSFRGPFILDQVKAIERAGNYRIIVFKPKAWHSKEKDYVFEEIAVYRFKTFELPSNILPGLFNKLSAYSMRRKLMALKIDVKDIAIVHSHVTGMGFLANALKKMNSKIKTIVQHHGFDVLNLEQGWLRNFIIHRWWVKKYGINICNKIDLHVGVSEKTLNYLTSFPTIKLKDQFILYNGVDTSKFYPIDGLKDPKYFTIGCIGNFWPLKDQITLIKAIEILIRKDFQNLRLKLVGTGQTLEKCKKYVKEHKLELQVEFISEIRHDKLIYFYNSLDLFVLPSYYEAFGCVYAEAHVCGVPFIGVREQGISELIPELEKDKWLIEKSNVNHLATLISDFATNRYQQYLNINFEINYLLSNFLNTL